MRGHVSQRKPANEQAMARTGDRVRSEVLPRIREMTHGIGFGAQTCGLLAFVLLATGRLLIDFPKHRQG